MQSPPPIGPRRKRPRASSVFSPSASSAMPSQPDESPAQASTSTAASSPAVAHGQLGRTGKSRSRRACESCKVRKIKCDDNPGRCENCLRSGEECLFVDHLSGRKVVRDHTDNLEHRISEFEAYVATLEGENSRLRNLLHHQGVDPDGRNAHRATPSHGHMDECTVPASLWSPVGAEPIVVFTAEAGVIETSSDSFATASSVSKLHVGVSPQHGALQDVSAVTGYNLNVFGINLNILDFISSETWPYQEEMTWKYFLKWLHDRPLPIGSPPPSLASLPSQKAGCRRYMDTYMATINVWTPVLTRPQLEELVDRIYYDGDSLPQVHLTAADICTIHMVFALVKQGEFMSGSDDSASSCLVARAEAFEHYNFVIRHFAYLLHTPSLDTMQVMVLICAFVRLFPHPAPCWMATHWTMAIALDLNLHRSAKSLPGRAQSQIGREEAERRKRLFWSMLVMRISSCGQVARPVELRWEDFDIEVPQVMPDTNNFRVPDQRCSFRPGIELMRLSRIYLDALNDVFAVRRTANYELKLSEIGRKQELWRSHLPLSLGKSSQESTVTRGTRQESLFPSIGAHVRGGARAMLPALEHATVRKHAADSFSTYRSKLNYCDAKLTLMLHHPTVCVDVKSHIKAESNSKCIEASREIIESVEEMRESHAMDSTWGSASTYIAAILTLLAAHESLPGRLSQDTRETLGKDIDVGLANLDVLGKALGSDDSLVSVVKGVWIAWSEKMQDRDWACWALPSARGEAVVTTNDLIAPQGRSEPAGGGRRLKGMADDEPWAWLVGHFEGLGGALAKNRAAQSVPTPATPSSSSTHGLQRPEAQPPPSLPAVAGVEAPARADIGR